MSWNKHSAVTFARQHAHQQSTHFCARAVAAAIRAGGIQIEGANAMNFDRSLERAGFRQVYGEPIEGDVAVISALPGPHQYGHTCIYDGMGTWYSDFIQRSMYPGPHYRELHPAFKLYRHN
ncbi:CHAP domain-containing protein [Citrobacter koseri]|uniref:CHAP domain-containing protein n=1 Tax=Citrobacter koseri TaxID=545 RepID=UPI00397CEE27